MGIWNPGGENTGSPSSLYEPHKQHNMASNYVDNMEVVKSENPQ